MMSRLLVNRLKHRVTILRPPRPDETDEAGQPIDDWQPVVTVWAAIEPLRGRELESARQVIAEVTTRIRIRFRKGVDRTMRVKYNASGTEFDILYIIHPEFAKKELQLLCKEHQ